MKLKITVVLNEMKLVSELRYKITDITEIIKCMDRYGDKKMWLFLHNHNVFHLYTM